MDFIALKSAIAAVCTDAKLLKELTSTCNRFEKRASRKAKQTAASAAVEVTAPDVLAALTTMVTALNTPVRLADVGKQVELSNRVPAERQLLAKCFNFLQKHGSVQQVGFASGEVLAVDEVNNFQRRWIPTGWEPEATVDAEPEVEFVSVPETAEAGEEDAGDE